jgi:pimeloyl-ACP methyl ester carboxylesterase
MSRMEPNAYRKMEGRLCSEYGVEVVEHSVGVESLASSVRVLEVGTGEPIVFVHGSPNGAATWIPLASQLLHRRCLLVERPGAGLSSPVADWGDHRTASVAVLDAVLSRFGLDRVDLAGSSFGGLYAYNFALAHPERVRALIQLGSPGGPAALGMPAIFRFLSLPLPRFMVSRALRPDAVEARKMFVEIGHGAAVGRGAIPGIIFEWYASLLNHTDTVEQLNREVRAIATPFGYRRGGRLDDAAVATVAPPLLYLWGDRDTFATPFAADRLAALTPGAKIEHFGDFGHVLWYDDPVLVAERIEHFVAGLAN